MTIQVTTEIIKRKIYSNIEVDGHKYTLIDMLDESGKTVDTIVRDDLGNDVHDPDVFEQVEALVNEFQG